MSLFQYKVVLKEREDNVERGTVKAVNEEDAIAKLERLGLPNPKLREVKGMMAFFKQFTADVK